jgi:hypothetical protein
MDFFFTGLWGFIYLVALIVAGCFTFVGKITDERRILHVLLINWFFVRCIVSFMDKDETAFMASSIFAVVALAVYARTMASSVCAILFFIIMQFDILDRMEIMSFSEAAEIQDAIGFVVLFIMAGAANDFWTGKFSRLPNLWRNRGASHFPMLGQRGYSKTGPILGSVKDEKGIR